jgi:hypothetical protein
MLLALNTAIISRGLERRRGTNALASALAS